MKSEWKHDHELLKAYSDGYLSGRADALDELYSHKYKEEDCENDTMVHIWKSWFEKMKGVDDGNK